MPTTTAPRKQSRSIMPWVFLAIAVASVAASLFLWKNQRDNPPTQGERVIATTNEAVGDLAITEVHAPEIWHCSAGADNQVVLSWATTGAQSVDIKADDVSKPLFTGQASSSQVSVPAPCAPDARTYTVIAKSTDGKTTVTKSATTRGV